MGGIVARTYIQSSEYDNDVDQVIFLGTPQLGSPDAYLQYEAVEGFEGKEETIAKIYFQIEASKHLHLNLVNYVREHVPALSELLPIYDYLKKKDGDNWVLRSYPTEDYPRNTFLETLNLPAGITLLKQRARITNIISDHQAKRTINFIKTIDDPDTTDNKWLHGYPENFDNTNTDRGLERGAGDGTVPMSSADGLPGVTKVLCENNPAHRQMPTECQRHVIQSLTGQWPAGVYRASEVAKTLIIYVHSPVEFQVVDQNGATTGINFTDHASLEGIPGSLFDQENGVIFLKNPSSGEYKINVIGIDGGGEYGLSVDLIDDNGNQQSLVTGTIGVGETQNYKINYDDNSTASVAIEKVETKITIDDIIKEVKKIVVNGGFKQKNLDKVLITQLQLAKRWEAKINTTTKEWQKKIYQNLILVDIKVVQNLLKVWLKTKKIDQVSFDILDKDLNLLIQQYK